MVLSKLLSVFLKPRSGRYLDPVRIYPSDIGCGTSPFDAMFLIKQPEGDESIGLRVDYRLPKGCVKHHVLLRTHSGSGDLLAGIWLEAGRLKMNDVYCLMNSIDEDILRRGSLRFIFSDGKWPVCDNRQFDIYLSDFEVT